MTAHGLRQLPPTVSGCFVFVFAVFVFVFFFSKTLEMFMYVVPLSLALPWIIHLARSQSRVVVFLFCLEVISFCLVFEDETKGSTQKGEKGDQVTVSLITVPREKSLFAFHVWTPSNGSRKKYIYISVACVAGARTAWLFVPGRTIKLHLRLCVQICLCRLCKRWSAQYCVLHLRSVISHNSKGGQFMALRAGGKGH